MAPASNGYNDLSPEEERVFVRKGTEMPGSGEYLDNKAEGAYICRRCSAAELDPDSSPLDRTV